VRRGLTNFPRSCPARRVPAAQIPRNKSRPIVRTAATVKRIPFVAAWHPGTRLERRGAPPVENGIVISLGGRMNRILRGVDFPNARGVGSVEPRGSSISTGHGDASRRAKNIFYDAPEHSLLRTRSAASAETSAEINSGGRALPEVRPLRQRMSWALEKSFFFPDGLAFVPSRPGKTKTRTTTPGYGPSPEFCS